MRVWVVPFQFKHQKTLDMMNMLRNHFVETETLFHECDRWWRIVYSLAHRPPTTISRFKRERRNGKHTNVNILGVGSNVAICLLKKNSVFFSVYISILGYSGVPSFSQNNFNIYKIKYEHGQNVLTVCGK